MEVEEKSVIHDVLGYVVRWSLGVFYTDDGIIGSRDTEWIQGPLNIRIGLFHRIDLMDNTDKSKTMMCQPGEIRPGILGEAVG